MKENRKQLEELLRRFYDEEQAVQAASEIESAEAYLAAESPLPGPDVLAEIKRSLLKRSAVLSGKRRFYRRAWIAAAACLALAVGLLWNLQQRTGGPLSPRVALPDAIVQEFFSDDAVSEISSKLDDISEQIYDGSDSEKNDPWTTEVDSEIEDMVLVAQADFWKG